MMQCGTDWSAKVGPAVQGTRRRHATGAVASRAQRLKGQAGRETHRHVTPRHPEVAELAARVEPPAVRLAAGRECAAVIQSRSDRDELLAGLDLHRTGMRSPIHVAHAELSVVRTPAIRL